jgi:hypothetical protein
VEHREAVHLKGVEKTTNSAVAADPVGQDNATDHGDQRDDAHEDVNDQQDEGAISARR